MTRASKKDKIVSAARDLLMTDGYGLVQAAAVARRAGVTRLEVDELFGSRTALVQAALDFHWSEIKPFIDEVFSPSVPPLERFRRFFSGASGFQKHHAERVGCVVGCLLLRVGSSVPRAEEEIRRGIQERVAELQQLIERAVRDAQAQGLVRKGDAAAKAWTVVHYLEGMLGIARIDGNLQALDGALERVLEFLGVEPAQAQ
jgi:TetR/AcrR family transcriptional repressor of nem operon